MSTEQGKPPPSGTTKLPAPPPPRPPAVRPLGTPVPAPSRPPNSTAVDRGIEVRMAIGVADTHHNDASTRLDPGLQLRQYELIRELGRGGMGQVFLARDVKLARRVAIKFLATTSREATDRFLAEARTTAVVNHENIVVIHEVDEHEGTPHMVLEYLEGTTLRELMRGRAFAPSRVVELMAPVVRAVARAHAAGIVHRDLKPENIVVTIDGAIKVLDFGIAKALVNPDARHVPIDAAALADINTTALTGKSAIVGTPMYMAPEQFGFDVVDQRSDLWSIGVILFELATGRHPLASSTLGQLLGHAAELDEPMPRIGSLVADLPERLERIVDRCLAKRKDSRYADAASLLRDLESLVPGRYGRKLRDDESPYPGLTAFQEDDADRFFGRARDIARVVTRLSEQPLVGIAGPSGIGKSSFVRAGIIPALKASGDPWESYVLRPGRQPLLSLAGVLSPLTRSASFDGSREIKQDALREQLNLVDRLAAEPGYLGTLLRERAARKNTRIMLFIDQFEELYTLVSDARERRAFTACLAGAADDETSPIRIVVSIRSDFLDRVGEHRDFLDQLTRGLGFLQPLGRAELREALIRPLDMLGYELEGEDLVHRMLDDLATAQGALPLLQFAGTRLWDARDRTNKRLTRAAHDAMGGVTGALVTHADQVLASLPTTSHGLVRAIFQRLVTPERTRAIVDLADLEQLGDAGDVTRVIDQLVAARLLVVQTQGAATVEIVHESLLVEWPTLRRWLDEDQDDAALLAQLATAAKQWEAKQRAPGLLWRGEIMEEARRWYTQRPRRLAAREQAFLDAVLALARRGRRARRAALLAAFIVLGAIATGASIGFIKVTASEQRAVEALDAKEKEEKARRIADQERLIADKERNIARLALLSEEQLREAAEAGLVTAAELADVAEHRRRVAERKRAQAEAGLAAAKHDSAAMRDKLSKAEADRIAAEKAAQQHATEAKLTREELVVKNQQLEAALATAKASKAKAEAAQTKLQESLKAETARAERLEREKKKITTDLR